MRDLLAESLHVEDSTALGFHVVGCDAEVVDHQRSDASEVLSQRETGLFAGTPLQRTGARVPREGGSSGRLKLATSMAIRAARW